MVKIPSLVVAILLLGIVLIALSCEDMSGDGESTPQSTAAGSQPTGLNVGDCVILPGAISVECSEPHAGEVVGVFNITGDEYPGDEAILREAGEVCPADKTATYPTRTTWTRLDDRLIVCIRTASLNLEVGDCIIFGEKVQWVSCSRPHDAEVIAGFELAGVSYPGFDAIAGYADENCPADANWNLYPTIETWAVGHRGIACLDRAPP